MKIVQAKIGAILAVLAITALSGWAKPPISKPAEAPLTVIAHVPGLSADVMFLSDEGDERYLYSEKDSNEGFVIVNVTNPSRPNVVKRANSATKAFGPQLRPIGGGLALTEAIEAGSGTAAIPSTRTVRVLDLSDPANPRIALSFSGVTSTLVDKVRSLV